MLRRPPRQRWWAAGRRRRRRRSPGRWRRRRGEGWVKRQSAAGPGQQPTAEPNESRAHRPQAAKAEDTGKNKQIVALEQMYKQMNEDSTKRAASECRRRPRRTTTPLSDFIGITRRPSTSSSPPRARGSRGEREPRDRTRRGPRRRISRPFGRRQHEANLSRSESRPSSKLKFIWVFSEFSLYRFTPWPRATRS